MKTLAEWDTIMTAMADEANDSQPSDQPSEDKLLQLFRSEAAAARVVTDSGRVMRVADSTVAPEPASALPAAAAPEAAPKPREVDSAKRPLECE